MPDGVGMGINPAGTWDFNVTGQREYAWQHWLSDIRRRGEFIRSLAPGSDRVRATCVLPAGSTRFDLLVAYGAGFPAAFNPNRVPDGETVLQVGQHADDPYDKQSMLFLDTPDKFIVGDYLPTIPNTRVILGKHQSLKRCGLCSVNIIILTFTLMFSLK